MRSIRSVLTGFVIAALFALRVAARADLASPAPHARRPVRSEHGAGHPVDRELQRLDGAEGTLSRECVLRGGPAMAGRSRAQRRHPLAGKGKPERIETRPPDRLQSLYLRSAVPRIEIGDPRQPDPGSLDAEGAGRDALLHGDGHAGAAGGPCAPVREQRLRRVVHDCRIDRQRLPQEDPERERRVSLRVHAHRSVRIRVPGRRARKVRGILRAQDPRKRLDGVALPADQGAGVDGQRIARQPVRLLDGPIPGSADLLEVRRGGKLRRGSRRCARRMGDEQFLSLSLRRQDGVAVAALGQGQQLLGGGLRHLEEHGRQRAREPGAQGTGAPACLSRDAAPLRRAGASPSRARSRSCPAEIHRRDAGAGLARARGELHLLPDPRHRRH